MAKAEDRAADGVREARIEMPLYIRWRMAAEVHDMLVADGLCVSSCYKV